MTRVTNTHSWLGEWGGGGEEKHRQKKEVDFTCYFVVFTIRPSLTLTATAGRDKNQQLENNRMNTKMKKTLTDVEKESVNHSVRGAKHYSDSRPAFPLSLPQPNKVDTQSKRRHFVKTVAGRAEMKPNSG